MCYCVCGCVYDVHTLLEASLVFEAHPQASQHSFAAKLGSADMHKKGKEVLKKDEKEKEKSDWIRSTCHHYSFSFTRVRGVELSSPCVADKTSLSALYIALIMTLEQLTHVAVCRLITKGALVIYRSFCSLTQSLFFLSSIFIFYFW